MTEEGREMELNEQPQKQPYSKIVTPSGKVTEVRDEQSLKQSLPKPVTPDGSLTSEQLGPQDGGLIIPSVIKSASASKYVLTPVSVCTQ